MKTDKDLKVSFYYTIFSFCLAISLKVEDNKKLHLVLNKYYK